MALAQLYLADKSALARRPHRGRGLCRGGNQQLYLADKSALARLSHRPVADRLGPLLVEGLVATCPIIDFEVLYSALSLADHEGVLAGRKALATFPVTAQTTERAMEVHHHLGRAQRIGLNGTSTRVCLPRSGGQSVFSEKCFAITASRAPGGSGTKSVSWRLAATFSRMCCTQIGSALEKSKSDWWEIAWLAMFRP